MANGGEGEGAMEGRVGWEVTDTCDFCKNIFTLNSISELAHLKCLVLMVL